MVVVQVLGRVVPQRRLGKRIGILPGVGGSLVLAPCHQQAVKIALQVAG